MKTLIIIMIFFSLLSCDKAEDFRNIEKDGFWQLESIVDNSTDVIEYYPEELDSFIEIELTKDSIYFYGCNRLLGGGKFDLTDKNDVMNYRFLIYRAVFIGRMG